jgi:bacillithiol biosynthesis deacetylase BshB1
MIDAMCIGAHPDDVEIGMGATVAKMVREGWKVAIVDLTNGEPTPHGSVERRAAESAKAAALLGADRITLSQPNRYLFDSVEARTELAQVIRELKPRLLFAPYATDAHPDHVAAAQIVTAARFYAKFTKTEMTGEPHYPSKLYRYMAVHLNLVVEPSFIVSVGEEDLAVKLRALGAYESQFAENPKNAAVVPMMEQLARVWGSRIGAAAGEPFYAIEPVGVTSPAALV